MRDVAARAGCSTTTVSHALSGHGRVDAQTRQRVLAVCEQLGYTPRRSAQSLRSGRTGVIGLLSPAVGVRLPDDELIGLEFYMRLTAEVARRAFELGMTVQLLPYAADFARIRDAEMDGALVSDPCIGDPVMAVLQRAGVPLVTLEQDPDRPDDPWYVRADHATSTAEVFDHLAARGAARPALLVPDAPWAWTMQINAAYEQWCRDNGVVPHTAWVDATPGVSGGARRVVQALLATDVTPDAIYAVTERYGNAVMDEAAVAGVDVPGELQVVVGVDSPWALRTTPALTAVSLSPERQGRAAVDLLLARIAGGPPAPVDIRAELVKRGSTRH